MLDINELISLDRSIYSTWYRYSDILNNSAQYTVEEIDAFLSALDKADDAYLGYSSPCKFFAFKAEWLREQGRIEEAVAVMRQELIYRPLGGVRGAAVTRYLGGQQAPPPLMYFSRGPLPVKQAVDVLDSAGENGVRATLFKGNDVYMYRFYGRYTPAPFDKWASNPDIFDANALMAANKDKFLADGYSLADFGGPHPPCEYRSPYLNRFFAACGEGPERGDARGVADLLNGMAAQPGGEFAYTVVARMNSEVSGENRFSINFNSNGEMTGLLFVLKSCGYMDTIFKALPLLPEDFPLLLCCFNDADIRQKVEDHMRIPGLKAAYDLAFAPRKANLKEQLHLIDFGERHPRFQELLATSLHTYGYHVYNPDYPSIDWMIQDYAHFYRALGGDILLPLTSRADLLPCIRDIYEFGPGAGFAAESIIAQGFQNSWEYILRTLLGFVALRKDANLNEWIAAYPVSDWSKSQYSQLKLFELVDLLRNKA